MLFRYPVSSDIELQLLTHEHTPALFKLIQDNRTLLERWQPEWNKIQNLEELKAYITFALDRFVKNNGFFAAIYFQGRLAGIISCNEIDWHCMNTNLGYWLGEEFHGRGIVTQCCQSLINYFFKELKINRIVIDPAVNNVKSRAIPEKLGFTQEGILRQRFYLHGEYVDCVVYALLAQEWPSAQESVLTQT